MTSNLQAYIDAQPRTGLEPAGKNSRVRQSCAANEPRFNCMRIIHIVKHCSYANGNVHVAVDLACVQAQAGCEVTFVSSGGTFVGLLEQYGVRHVTLAHEQRQPWSVLRTAFKVSALTREIHADVLHAHMMSSAVVGYIASRLSGVPLVTTVHNSFDRHSILMRLGDMAVAVSESERASLLQKGYRSSKLTAIMNAPDKSPREDFMDDGREPLIEAPCIVAANALHRRKGVFDLIDACTVLFKELPNWKLYIAGEGPDREKLEQQVRACGMEDRMIFLGFLPAPRKLLSKADIFVLASYADPCSLAVGEARAAGCAIVATHVGGTPEMLDFGRAGRLISPGRHDQLTATLRDLMVNPDARDQLRRAALLGSEVFDVRRLLEDYGKVYVEACAQRGISTIPMLTNKSPERQNSSV